VHRLGQESLTSSAGVAEASPPVSAGPAWRALEAHHRDCGAAPLRQLFAEDARRGLAFTAQSAGIYLDYSKQRVTTETLALLLELAAERSLRARIDAMFRGDKVNRSEQRAALHVALRASKDAQILVDGKDIVPAVHDTLARMADFAERIRAGRWQGHAGRGIRNIVNLGIGGSDLGPSMACEALAHFSAGVLQLRFVSNVDPADFAAGVQGLDPAETLFIVVSKTFTTTETLANARAARDWLVAGHSGDAAAVARHFAAVSSNAGAVADFGIAPELRFALPDWVGGRYSLGSAVGLALMIAIGPARFSEMLEGMRAMDEHFRTAPPAQNLPVLMGLVAIWNNNFLGAQSAAVLPYAQSLARFPAFVQQLAMESSGKGVTEDGVAVGCDTGPACWGGQGTNGQHSFHQLLHQGTRLVACDFIGLLQPPGPADTRHDILLANMLAQGEALAFGKTAAELRAEGCPEALVPHRVLEGNRPSSALLLDSLAPASLGALVALYEHSVFTQGAIWGIDSFDQWGVELGKSLAGRIVAELAPAGPAPAHDSSTNELIRRCRIAKVVPPRP
jgi:glucose-6-phosphate isomerase